MKVKHYDQMMAWLTRPGYAKGGRIGSGNPIVITPQLLKKVDRLIKTTNQTLKQIGEALGYEADLRSDSYLIREYEKKYGKISSERFKPYKLANDPKYVKKVVDEVKRPEGSIKAAAEKFGKDRKTIKNILNQYKPSLRGKTNIAGPETGAKNVKKRRLKIMDDLRKEVKGRSDGPTILKEMDKKLRDIKLMNDDVLAMSDEAIWKNKRFQDAMRLDVTALKNDGALKFDRYKDLSKKEFIDKIRDLARKKEFVQAEHQIPIRAKNPESLMAKNIFPAFGKVGGQMEVLKNTYKKNPGDKRGKTIFGFLKSQNMPIEGKQPGTLGKLFRTLGTPASGAGLAVAEVASNVGEGKNIADAVVDPLVGLELSFPSLFKENVSKITKNPKLQKLLTLGKFGTRFMGPVGLGITALGLGKEAYNVLKEDKARRESITPEMREAAQEIDFNEDFMAAGGGIANIRRPGAVPPESGPMPHGGGLSYRFNRVKKLTE